MEVQGKSRTHFSQNLESMLEITRSSPLLCLYSIKSASAMLTCYFLLLVAPAALFLFSQRIVIRPNMFFLLTAKTPFLHVWISICPLYFYQNSYPIFQLDS